MLGLDQRIRLYPYPSFVVALENIVLFKIIERLYHWLCMMYLFLNISSLFCVVAHYKVELKEVPYYHVLLNFEPVCYCNIAIYPNLRMIG